MPALIAMMHHLMTDESGTSMVEEALILAVMVIAVMFGVVNITNTLQDGIFGIAESIGDVSPAS